jgi:hypothetical protein
MGFMQGRVLIEDAFGRTALRVARKHSVATGLEPGNRAIFEPYHFKTQYYA